MKSVLKILFVITFAISCNSQQKGIENVVREWHGKEIVLPQQIEYKTLGQSSASSALWDSTYKILTYIDSIGCSSCQLGLSNWQMLIDSSNFQKLDVSFLFIVHSSDFLNFDKEVLLYNFDYPIIYDYQNQFYKLNRFPPAPYRTFLLDKDNKVQITGSPINNPMMWELYKKEITRQPIHQ